MYKRPKEYTVRLTITFKSGGVERTRVEDFKANNLVRAVGKVQARLRFYKKTTTVVDFTYEVVR